MSKPYGHLGWRQIKMKEPPEPRPPARGRGGAFALEWSLVSRLTYLIVGLYALTFALLSIQQHDSFNTHAFDLGNMDQAVWNTAQGRWFRFTNWESGTTRLAAHVEPILLPISQLYRLYSSPKTLLVLQSIVLSLGALPALWLAREKLGNTFAAITFASAYLLSPALEAANLADFHPVALSSSLLLFAFYFVEKRWYPLFFITALLAMGTKEQVPLSVMLIGLYVVFVQKNQVVGWTTVVLSLLWVGIAFLVVIPYFNPTGASPYLSRYDHLGGSFRGIILTFLTDPGHVLANLTEPMKVQYVASLLEPVAFLSLLNPLLLGLALPDLAISLLSNFPDMYSGRAHYGAVIVPFVVISGIYGTHLLGRQVQRLSPRLANLLVYLLAMVVLAFSIKSYYRSVLLPLSDHLPELTAHHKLAKDFITLIPSEAAVSTSSALNPHVSQREGLFLFPNVEKADYVFLDVTSTPYPLDVPSQRWRVDQLLESGRWSIVSAKDGYLLLRRGGTQTSIPEGFYSFARARAEEIRQRVDVVFGDSLRLVGYNLHPGGKLHGSDPYASVTLFWQVLKPEERDNLIVLSVVGDSAGLISRQAYDPTTTWYPTSRWKVGELVRVDVERMPLGSYPWGELLVGVAEGRELRGFGSRLLSPNITMGDGLELRGTQLKIAELRRG